MSNLTAQQQYEISKHQKVQTLVSQSELDRICLRCGDKLSINDDLICGFHHLEN